MELVSLKWDGSRHRHWLTALSTMVPNVYYIPPNSEVVEADGRVWSSDYPVIAHFWPRHYIQVFTLLKDKGTDYYCNVITPIVCSRGQVMFIDLDLDVIVTPDSVHAVDEDEFLRRQFLYPKEWTQNASHASEHLVHMARRRMGVFSEATNRTWRMYVDKVRISKFD